MRPPWRAAPGGRPARAADLLALAASIGGYAFTAALLVQGFASGRWPFPGGDVVDFYAGSGDAFRSAAEVYFPGFFYGPPWVVLFGAVSWVGPATIHAVILALDAVALWTIVGGNLRRLGYFLWFPLIAFEIAAGQLNLVAAAAMVAAQRGTIWPLAAISLAKVWPAVSLPLRHWRRFVVEIALFSLITLPWLLLWPQWFETLFEASKQAPGPVIPVPWIARAAAAAALLLLRRSWSRALAAAILSPALYWGQLVVLVAPLSLWLDRRELDAPRGP